MMLRHLLLSCLTAKGVRERVYVGPVLLVFLFVSGMLWTETSVFSAPYNGIGTFLERFKSEESIVLQHLAHTGLQRL